MPIPEKLLNEWHRLRRAVSRLDRQTTFVLIAAAALVVLQDAAGSRRMFRTELAGYFPLEVRGILTWAWWFGMQGITGFVLPVLMLIYFFGRRPSEIGLGTGDRRFALTVAALYLPLVIIGTWFLSNSVDFQIEYPHYQPATQNWAVFVLYESLFLLYWIGWEYLWRGFVLFGTAHTFGLYAILIQAIPFTVLHISKPLPESILSLVGGIGLGMLVWRCRSFWIAVPIHAAQMMILDLWCTLRIRTGIRGVGLDALIRMISG